MYYISRCNSLELRQGDETVGFVSNTMTVHSGVCPSQNLIFHIHGVKTKPHIHTSRAASRFKISQHCLSTQATLFSWQVNQWYKIFRNFSEKRSVLSLSRMIDTRWFHAESYDLVLHRRQVVTSFRAHLETTTTNMTTQKLSQKGWQHCALGTVSTRFSRKMLIGCHCIALVHLFCSCRNLQLFRKCDLSLDKGTVWKSFDVVFNILSQLPFCQSAFDRDFWQQLDIRLINNQCHHHSHTHTSTTCLTYSHITCTNVNTHNIPTCPHTHTNTRAYTHTTYVNAEDLYTGVDIYSAQITTYQNSVDTYSQLISKKQVFIYLFGFFNGEWVREKVNICPAAVPCFRSTSKIPT